MVSFFSDSPLKSTGFSRYIFSLNFVTIITNKVGKAFIGLVIHSNNKVLQKASFPFTKKE